MPISANWYDDEHTIIKVDIPRDSTWGEYYTAVEWIISEVQKVNHNQRVDLIFHEEAGMPKGNPIPHFKWAGEKMTKINNIGHTFIVGAKNGLNSYVRMLMNIIAKNFMPASIPQDSSRRLIFVSTLEAALEQIRNERKNNKPVN